VTQRSTEKTKHRMQRLNATGAQLNASNADFLKIDVETALIFCGLALETNNEEKKERNRKNARKAYDTILQLWGNVAFTPSQESYMHEMMHRLKGDLKRLGERFD